MQCNLQGGDFPVIHSPRGGVIELPVCQIPTFDPMMLNIDRRIKIHIIIQCTLYIHRVQALIAHA